MNLMSHHCEALPPLPLPPCLVSLAPARSSNCGQHSPRWRRKRKKDDTKVTLKRNPKTTQKCACSVPRHSQIQTATVEWMLTDCIQRLKRATCLPLHLSFPSEMFARCSCSPQSLCLYPYSPCQVRLMCLTRHPRPLPLLGGCLQHPGQHASVSVYDWF